MEAAVTRRGYSCASAPQTREWMDAIADFLRPWKPLIDAHVVNFFKDRLWEMVDEEWMECLRKESVENLLGIPSGFVRDYWPPSLQEFILTVRSLAFPREPNLSHSILPNLHMEPLGSVLSQGMNLKKKHEVGILAAVIKTIADGSNSQTIIDVGSGQGYLAQALTFQYHLSVIAIDASLHHATVTSTRAERIKKHFAAKSRGQHWKVPQTVICHVLSSNTLTALITASSHKDNAEKSNMIEHNLEIDSQGSSEEYLREKGPSFDTCDPEAPLVLAGLHACGDLSVNMLRTFLECKQVKALVSIGCCYNLLSEECEKDKIPRGFPMSSAAKESSLILGKNARDLACQSAERWRSLTKEAALQNFELHAFRASLQMVLDRFFPTILTSSPSVGRQGKALRRQQNKRVLESRLGSEERNFPVASSTADPITVKSNQVELIDGHYSYVEPKLQEDVTRTPSEIVSHSTSCSEVGCKEAHSLQRLDQFMLFKEFSKSGLRRLGMTDSQDINFLEIWKEAQPFSELIGPYWSLRAALGQLVETYILLDRLMFVQEQDCSVEVSLVSLFDPTLSPRNVAIVARKTEPIHLKEENGIEAQRCSLQAATTPGHTPMGNNPSPSALFLSAIGG